MKPKLFLFISMAFVFSLPISTNAQTIISTSWEDPYFREVQGNTCLICGSIYYDDESYLVLYDEDAVLVAKWFFTENFPSDIIDIPSNAVITGIQVKIDARKWYNYDLENALNVRLRKQDGTFSPTTLVSGNIPPTENTYLYVGGDSELWGLSWDKNDFGDEFGVELNPVNSNFRIDIDIVWVKINYFVPEEPVISSVTASPDNICEGGSTTLTVSGELKDALEWHWYEASCGGTDVGSGTSVMVSPASTTTYYVRGEGGYISDAACDNVSVTVDPQPVGPALSDRFPDLAEVCDGQDVSATFTSGSGGVGCSDEYQYSTDGSTWSVYIPDDPIASSGLAGSSITVRGRRSGCTSGSGCTGTDWETLATWNVVVQPVGPTLNNRIPDLEAICEEQEVSATFTTGSGGVGCSDEYQYSTDGSSWSAYTPGDPIPTTGLADGSLAIQGRRSGCTSGAGCTGTNWETLAIWTIAAQPAGPSIDAKTPGLSEVCEGKEVSALFTSGSGGVGCSDEYQYSTDGNLWSAYIPGDPIATSGLAEGSVTIRGRRSGCTSGTGCTGTNWETLATWDVVAQPVGPTLNNRIPDLEAVCEEQEVSATFIPGSGGVGCSDEYQYSFDGSSWTQYSEGNPIYTQGNTGSTLLIQGRRSGCSAGSGCTGSNWITLASWGIISQPVGPALDVKIPDQAIICGGEDVSATFIDGSGGLACSDEFQYSIDGSSWLTYTSGTLINTAGLAGNTVTIQGRRGGCADGAGCDGSGWETLAAWDIGTVPEINCPYNITINNEPGGCAAELNFVDDYAAVATGNPKPIITYVPVTGISFPVGTFTVTATATNICGSDQCTFTVTVVDNEPPDITCPADHIDLYSESGLCTANIDPGTAIAFDNCGVASIEGVRNDGELLTNPYPFGTVTITWTATDVNDNTSTCEQIISVEHIVTSTEVDIDSYMKQYSDPVTFTATISPGNCVGFEDAPGDATGTVEFFIISDYGEQSMGTASVINGIATLPDVALLENEGTDPPYREGVLAPGLKDVRAVYTSTNPNYEGSEDTDKDLLNLTTETADIEYVGVTLQATPSVNENKAPLVVLMATVRDFDDTNRGDIRNACVTFFNGETQISPSIPVTEWVDPLNPVLGVVTYNWTNVDAGGYVIEARVGCYYQGSDVATVEVYIPEGDFITGGGYIIPDQGFVTNSFGTIASNGQKWNFGYNIKYLKKGKKLTGHVNIITRSGDGRVFQIKSNAMASLGVDIGDPDNLIGIYTAKANLTEVTDGMENEIAGNLLLQMTTTDRGNPGSNDEIGISLWSLTGANDPVADELLLSSEWNGLKTLEQYLAGGNLVVHSGASFTVGGDDDDDGVEKDRKKKTGEIMSDSKNVSQFRVYPNPFSELVNFEFTPGKDTKAKLDIFDIRGKKLATLIDHDVTAGQDYRLVYKPGFTANGILFYVLNIDEKVQTGKIFYNR